MRRIALLLLACACAGGRWESKPAEHPATRAELAVYPVSVASPALREAMAAAGFVAVAREPWSFELELSWDGEVATLRSGGFFVDEVRGASPGAIARALAVSDRVAWFIRNSGTVEQRAVDQQP